MDKNLLIKKTARFARRKMRKGKDSSHDWQHIERVAKLARHIAVKEGADVFTIELAVLLHDLEDWKFAGIRAAKEQKIARAWLKANKIDPQKIDEICSIISAVSFQKGKNRAMMHTIEGKVVQDADRLDAMGAIGIARAFAYGGHKGRPFYDLGSQAEIRKDSSSTISHFYEKLFLLKGKMNTRTARNIAKGRHEFMKNFVAEFYKEIKGPRHDN